MRIGFARLHAGNFALPRVLIALLVPLLLWGAYATSDHNSQVLSEQASYASLKAEMAAGIANGTLVEFKAEGPRAHGEVALAVGYEPRTLDTVVKLRRPNGEIFLLTEDNVNQVAHIVRASDPRYAVLAERYMRQM